MIATVRYHVVHGTMERHQTESFLGGVGVNKARYVLGNRHRILMFPFRLPKFILSYPNLIQATRNAIKDTRNVQCALRDGVVNSFAMK